MNLNNSYSQSGAGSTPVVPLAQPFFMSGNAVGIVIIHGYGGSIADYRQVAEELHRFGYTVLGARLAGHGQGQVILRQVSIADCQESVASAVAEMKKTCKHIFLMGSSYGGVLSLDYAEHHPDVAGMILVNTALSYSGAGMFQGLILRVLRLFTPDYTKKGLSPEEQEHAKNIGSSPAWPINGILATSRFARQKVVPQLPQLHVPALILHSQNDPVVGVKNSQKLSQLLGSTTKKILEIPVTTHRPFRHQQAVMFIAHRTQEFIQAVIAS